MGRSNDSPSSSIDSSGNFCKRKEELSTDLRLGMSTWSARDFDERRVRSNGVFFIKVHMEGVPIGRKVNLLELNSYEDLVLTLRCLFAAEIKYPHSDRLSAKKSNVLTYEDEEGDWMVVGDVPWEIFLSSVKRLKITRGDSL